MSQDDGIDWGAMQGELPDDNAGTNWWDEGYGHDPNNWGIDEYPTPTSTGLPTQAAQGASWIQKLLGGVGKAQNYGDLASLMGAFSSGEKANRWMQGNFTQNYDRLMLDAQKDRNSNESDALKKLAQTSYITGGGSQFKPALLTLNGKQYQTTDQGIGPKPTTDVEKAGAASLQGQLQARLAPGGSYTPQPLNDYAKPGVAENIGSYGAVGLGALGGLTDAFGGPGGSSGVAGNIAKGVGTAGSIMGMMGKLPGLGTSSTATAGAGTAGSGAMGTLGTIGKVAGPIAGGALGTYGLIKNQSVGSDVMSGVGAGASIGSFAGPIGTAVGAGVGALVGALRGAFSVTAKEQGGRDAQAQVAQNLKQLSSPQQQAEAAKSGWPDPNQALSLIVMRDKLTQSGLPPQQAEAQAEQYMHSIWDAEKSGPGAVQQAASPIQSMMGRG